MQSLSENTEKNLTMKSIGLCYLLFLNAENTFSK